MTTARRDDELHARVAWSRLAEPEDSRLRADLARIGYVRALQHLKSGRLTGWARFRARLEALDVTGDIERSARIGVRPVIPGDDDWPPGLDDLAHPPHCLWVRGEGGLADLLDRSVAVVGARAATSYGENEAMEVGSGVADGGHTVVSGAAFGIDAAAHRGALSADGPTVAVLACGLDRAYPSAHRDLLDRIATVGAVVSELPIGSAPFRGRFLSRNRLIATMSRGTVVVEAGLRSGSLNTARTAAKHGRVVMAVPGPVTSMVSAGCHQIVREGVATLVTDHREILGELGPIGADIPERPAVTPHPEDDLTGPARAVYGALPVRRGAPTEALATQTTLTAMEVLSVLGELELHGLALRADEGWRRPRRTRA